MPSKPDKTVPARHGVIAKFLHWGFAGFFGYGMAKGLDNVNQLADPTLLNFELGFASLFLAILGFRFWYVRRVGASVLAENTPKWMKFGAKAGHLSIYGSLAMIAITGLAIGGLYAIGITGGAIMDAVIGLHEFSISASLVILGIHIAAALFHRLKGDGVWSAMVPLWKEKSAS